MFYIYSASVESYQLGPIADNNIFDLNQNQRPKFDFQFQRSEPVNLEKYYNMSANEIKMNRRSNPDFNLECRKME